MAGTNVVEVTGANFGDVVGRSSVPVLVDFWAEWCGPCKMLAPLLDELAAELAGKCTIAKVNVDHASEIAQQFNVQAIPTLILFKDGKVADQMVGVASKKDILAKIVALG